MAGVLTMSSNVTCGHGPGKVATSSSAKLKVSGSSVLLEAGIDGMSITGCNITPASDSTGITASKCSLVATVPPSPPPAITAGRATKLKVGGLPVMLDTLAGKTNGMVLKVTPQLLLAGTAIQTKLTAV